MRYQGRITSWKDDQGYGFITPNGGGGEIFAHIRAFDRRQGRPTGNEIVTYELSFDARRRARAIKVAFVAPQPAAAPGQGQGRLAPLFAIAFLGFVGLAVFVGRLPIAVLALYLLASLLSFFAYAFDKLAAQRQQWRTRESTLHLFALFGGWPGALAAQRLLRHKSAKASFQLGYWFTVLLNCAALGWLFSVPGQRGLHAVLTAL
jgi:uncharacterized membrane protein YsdA (DUF1294 family)/cold shock CspA family protein